MPGVSNDQTNLSIIWGKLVKTGELSIIKRDNSSIFTDYVSTLDNICSDITKVSQLILALKLRPKATKFPTIFILKCIQTIANSLAKFVIISSSLFIKHFLVLLIILTFSAFTHPEAIQFIFLTFAPFRWTFGFTVTLDQINNGFWSWCQRRHDSFKHLILFRQIVNCNHLGLAMMVY